VAAEVSTEPGPHRRGWHRDRGGHAEHGGGGGAAAPDLAKKEAKWIWWRRMVLGGNVADVVRMVWERRCGELVSISESVWT
jgi:hypothetical protein